MERFIGIVYKITDLDTGEFYIGETKHIKEFLLGKYNGSGHRWKNHYTKYKDNHYFKREILRVCRSKEEMDEYEFLKIKEHCSFENDRYIVTNKLYLNIKTWKQNEKSCCKECGSYTTHKTWCSNYKESIVCEECGGKRDHHNKNCSKYRSPRSCPECGNKHRHKKTCSQYVEVKVKVCEVCGGLAGHHYKSCPKYEGRIKTKERCSECGGTIGKHKKFCSKCTEEYKTYVCSICGGKCGYHEMNCSKYVNRTCDECGGKNSKHKKYCSKYHSYAPCQECGAANGHKKTCSKYYVGICSECGRDNKHHLKTCPNYKEKHVKCPICGNSKTNHKKWCSERIRK